MPKIKVVEIGQVCVYCGTETEAGCCGEVHNELGYEAVDDPVHLILESELTEEHEIVGAKKTPNMVEIAALIKANNDKKPTKEELAYLYETGEK